MRYNRLKIYIFILVLVGLQSLVFSAKSYIDAKNNPIFEQTVLAATSNNSLDNSKKSLFESKSKPIYSFPTKLFTQDNKLNVKVVDVGMNDNGSMQTPTWNEAGWYRYSAKPGEKGNVVINAHYDTNTGAKGAFWELKNVKVNDKVTLVDEYGKKYSYTISEIFYVDIHSPSRLDILKHEDNDTNQPSILTLITCGGVWLPGKATYSQRLVVKAELDS